jgi:competence protein ComEC
MRAKLLILFLVLYLGRLYFLQSPDYPVNRDLRIISRVTSEPYLSGSYQIIFINGLLIFTEAFPRISYGDKIEVIGKIEEGVTENGKRKLSLYFPKILILDHGEKASIWIKFRKTLIAFRHRLEDIFSQLLSEPQSSVLAGILLGTRATMPGDFFQSLKTTGTLHLIAASGYNLSVVAGVLISILVFVLPRKKALPIAFLGIFGYTFMAGASPSVVRAVIMASLTYLAQFLGREKEAVNGLLFSAGVMLLINPLIYSDISFQLSFGATAGILFLIPILNKIDFFRTNLFGKEIGLTLAAQLGVLPIILYHFKSIGILSPLVNALVLPLVPYIMGFGGLLAFLGLISVNFARIISFPTWVLLTIMVKIISWFGQINWANLVIEDFPFWGVGLYYFFLAMTVVLAKKKPIVSQ